MPALVGHVFIGVSVDGFIARPDGNLDWLTDLDLPYAATGYDDFMKRVDAVVVGRGTYETVREMEQWPYTKPLFVLSTTLTAAEVTRDDVSVHPNVDSIVEAFTAAGHANAHVDGGATIQSFLRAGLIDSLILSYAPVLIGSGVRLFGELPTDINLQLVSVKALPAGFTQTHYRVAR